MKRTANRFQRGSGVFECNSCHRHTRDTGGDNTQVRLCEECYEIGGIENQIADQGSTPELLAEIETLKNRCIEKGGKF
jgi:hypothetical protein